jgi:hypothetical protein
MDAPPASTLKALVMRADDWLRLWPFRSQSFLSDPQLTVMDPAALARLTSLLYDPNCLFNRGDPIGSIDPRGRGWTTA